MITSPAPSLPTSSSSFTSICAAKGQRARCCLLPVVSIIPTSFLFFFFGHSVCNTPTNDFILFFTTAWTGSSLPGTHRPLNQPFCTTKSIIPLLDDSSKNSKSFSTLVEDIVWGEQIPLLKPSFCSPPSFHPLASPLANCYRKTLFDFDAPHTYHNLTRETGWPRFLFTLLMMMIYTGFLSLSAGVLGIYFFCYKVQNGGTAQLDFLSWGAS